MRPGQLQFVAQEVSQMLPGSYTALDGLSIHGHRHVHLKTRLYIAHAITSCNAFNWRRVITAANFSRVSARMPGLSPGSRSWLSGPCSTSTDSKGRDCPTKDEEVAKASLGYEAQPK